MDYKNILEGTRPFFQGLPQPLVVPPQVTGPASPTPQSASSLPSAPTLAVTSRDSSRERSSEEAPQYHPHMTMNHHSLQHHHHLLNHHYSSQQHNHSGPHQTPNSNGNTTNTSASANKNSNNSKNNSSHRSSSSVPSNRESHSVINTSAGGCGRSSSGSRLDRLGHLHGHRSGSPLGHQQHTNHSTNSNSSLPLVLPQDGAALIRSKFEEGLGATLSQMYAGGHVGGYPPSLNLSRSSSHLNLASTTTPILSSDGQNPNSLSERQTPVIHSKIPNSASSPNTKNNSVSAPSNMVGVRRESPLDLSVKTVRQSADSSTSSLAFEQSSSVIGGVNGTRSLSSSGSSTPNMLTNSNMSLQMTNSVSSLGPNGSNSNGRDTVSTVIAAVANSTTNNSVNNNDRARSREKSREKDQGSRTSTPSAIRYPSPHRQRQQSPSSSNLHPGAAVHQRVANLNLNIPIPTPPPRTGSGSSAASAPGGGGVVPGHFHHHSNSVVAGLTSQQQQAQLLQQQQQQQTNHHLLSHYPQPSSASRLTHAASPAALSAAAAYQQHPHAHYPGVPQSAVLNSGSQNPPSSNSSSSLPARSSSVIPPYNPPLGAGLAQYHTNHHHHPTANSYPHHHATYPQYHPHFPAQPGQSAAAVPPQQMHHASFYGSYPHIQQTPQSQSTKQTPPQQQQTSSASSGSTSTPPSTYAQIQSKLSHPNYAPSSSQSHSQNLSNPVVGQPPPASPYYHPQSGYYGPPQNVTPQSQTQPNSRPGSITAHQQHPGYPSHHYGSQAQQASVATPYSHYSTHISYPTYLPSSQRAPSVAMANSSQQQPQNNYPSDQPTNANFQTHPGLRPTTPTGPPPPVSTPGATTGPYPSTPNQYTNQSGNEKSLQNQHSQPTPLVNSLGGSTMKPPENPSAPAPRGSKSGSSRKNVLNMLRNSVENRIQEKQEKEKFQFNHQTWNFHGRKFNTGLPPLNSSNSSGNSIGNGNVPTAGSHLGSLSSLGSSATGSNVSSMNSSSGQSTANLFGRAGFSKYESSSLGGGSDVTNNQQYNSLNTSGGGSGGSGGSNSNDLSPLHRIRTKAEKKQLFPNLLSQIEQENSHKEAEKMLQNSHIYSRNVDFNNGNSNSTSVFDFKEDEDEFGPKIIIPQPPPPSSGNLNKKPRSPKKLADGTRRNSLPKKGPNNASPSGKSSLTDPSLSHAVEKIEGRPISILSPAEVGSAGSATKAVTKAAAHDVDAFWAACDSFLDDLQSNPNSIKSRRGGLWQKLKSKSKPNTISGPGSTSGQAVNKTRGVRVRKNSTDEDSDFHVDEKSEEEEEEEEEEDSNVNSSSGDDDDDDPEDKSRSISSSHLKRKGAKKGRRVIDSEDNSAEDKSDENEDDKTSSREQRQSKSAERRKLGRKTGSKSNIKADSSDEDSNKGVKTKKGADSVSKVTRGSKSGEMTQSETKSRNRRRRSTRKTKVATTGALSDLDDEDATSRTSIGSEESDSEDSDGSGSAESFSGLDSDDSDRSTNSDDSDDSDGNSDQSMTSSGSRKRKGKGGSGSGNKKAKISRTTSSRRRLRRGDRLKKKGRSTRSQSSDHKGSKGKLKGKRTRSGSTKNDEEDDDNFEPKSALLKSRSNGRKRKLPKRNCAPAPGNGKLRDISGESGDGEGGSSGEEWIMRGDLGKKKPKRVFGDGSDFRRPGWEEELIDFKRKLRMPHKLIQVAKPSSLTMSPAHISSTQSTTSSATTVDKISTPFSASTTPSGQASTLAIKEEPSPAKSAKENKIPQGAKKRPSEKSPEKNAKDLFIGDKDSPAKPKIKGRPPKSSNATPEESVKVKNKGASEEKGKKKGKSKKALNSEKKSETSESPLDEPTIEMAVERMTTAAKRDTAALLAAQAAAAALRKLGPELKPEIEEHAPTINTNNKKKSVLQMAGGKMNSKKLSKEKSLSIDDEPPVLSPVDLKPNILSTPNAPADLTNSNNASPVLTPVPTTAKKGIRRNKFKSGFDYIRKKKKIATNPDGSVVIPPPKKVKIIIEKNVSAEDVQVEIRGWVLNKGHGETALHRAARLGYPDVAAYCLEHDICSANCKDNAGYTPLHETCIKGNLEVAKILLAYGANPSQAAPGGVRPLHEACENGHVELVRLLISYGADPTTTTYAGQSPLELAEPHKTVRLLLDEHINDVLGAKEKPWEFRGSGSWAEDPHEIGFDVTADPPLPDPDLDEIDGFEFESSEIPLPPLYKLKEKTPYYVLLNDVLTYLGLPRDKFLKTHPTAETVELNSNDFLEEAHCCHLLGEKFNLNSSSDLLTLIKYDEKIKKMLNIESCFLK